MLSYTDYSASDDRQTRRLRSYEDLLGRSADSVSQQSATTTAAAVSNFAGFVDSQYSCSINPEAAAAYSFSATCHW